MTQTSPQTYAFDNDHEDAGGRHALLGEVLDGFTVRRLSTLGNMAGWRCLELGAGGGSVARWLAGQVGPSGHVTATDLDIRHMPHDAGFTALRHDLTADPLPTGPWDLIHARLVLVHLSQRRELLRDLAATLRPGGALVLDEWDTPLGAPLLASAGPEAAAAFDAYTQGIRQILAASGVDHMWARKLHSIMREEGLVEVDSELHARAWSGGEPGALLHLANIAQLHAELLAAGVTEAQLDQVRALATDPATVVRGLVTCSTIGRRPAA